jgi:hypothetical protein
MNMGFFSALLGAEAKHAVRAVSDQIVAMDPSTASAAQLQTMEQDLDRVGRELAKFQAEALRENGEVIKIQTQYDRLVAAAAKMTADYDAETDETRKTGLGMSLSGLMETCEKLKSDLATEAQHKADADALVAETESIYKAKGADVLTARKNLESAARDMARAQVEKEHTGMMAENAARVAGLRNNEIDGLHGALDAMARKTADAKAVAEANRLKVQVLSHVDAGSVDDPNVKAALAAVSGAPSTQSFADRLAALKSK